MNVFGPGGGEGSACDPVGVDQDARGATHGLVERLRERCRAAPVAPPRTANPIDSRSGPALSSMCSAVDDAEQTSPSSPQALRVR